MSHFLAQNHVVYRIISAKIGPTSESLGARRNREKSKHSKVLGVYFTHVVAGQKPPGGLTLNFLVVDIPDVIM